MQFLLYLILQNDKRERRQPASFYPSLTQPLQEESPVHSESSLQFHHHSAKYSFEKALIPMTPFPLLRKLKFYLPARHLHLPSLDTETLLTIPEPFPLL